MKLYRELAEYYYSLEDKHRDINNDISLIKLLLKDRENPAILDAGCGTGEHVNLLSKLGYNCTGIDSSVDMLKIARERFPDTGKFIEQDMQTLDYFEDFDMLISLFGTFNYIIADTNVDKVLWNYWRALKPGGIALLEIWNSKPVEQIREKALNLISTTIYRGTIIDRERGFRMLDDNDKTVVEVNYQYTVKKRDDREVMKDRHIMRAFSKNEIKNFILKNGFKILNYYSNSIMEKYTEKSNRILFHMVKE